ncbi:MAG: hypothetical protein JWP35_721 [Caulobacter sp.]|nr:hypothetical protein [Caulobacter sp.]
MDDVSKKPAGARRAAGQPFGGLDARLTPEVVGDILRLMFSGCACCEPPLPVRRLACDDPEDDQASTAPGRPSSTT